MAARRYPSLFQINTRVRLSELSSQLGKPATLDDVPNAELDRLAAEGFDFVWFLGVWQTGEAGRKISATTPNLVAEYRRVLPDFRDGDVCGSCFAIREYKVHEDFGGEAALARLRARMRTRGLRLMLDFVPNHMAPDHPWVFEHPDWFVPGSEELIAQQPQNYRRVRTRDGERVLAYGRDPYFDGWSDTVQLNYGNPALQDAMLAELKRVARQCDGVRCDMAMLVLPEVFERTWKIASAPFWPRATAAVRKDHPNFMFMAEVYWDLEWRLLQEGFDYAYDKRLYDRLEHNGAPAVRGHLSAGLDFQDHLARFMENHDEPRAAATFPLEKHRAAAIITFFAPGLRFFHQGQREGRRVRIPVHLRRGPVEPRNDAIAQFYDQLIAALKDDVFHDGNWQMLECRRAWADNPTSDDFLVFAWSGEGDVRRLVVVNYSDHQSQCNVTLPWRDEALRLKDRMGAAVYDRASDLYLDLPAWGYHVFDVTAVGTEAAKEVATGALVTA